MNYETLLGVYHFCSAWHGGQFSREYRVMCRTGLVPRGAEEYLETLARPDYAHARDVYVSLVQDQRRRDPRNRREESGYVSCVCCGHAVVVDDVEAEDGVTMCDDCVAEDCDPREPCQCGKEGNFDDEDAAAAEAVLVKAGILKGKDAARYDGFDKKCEFCEKPAVEAGHCADAACVSAGRGHKP